MTPERLLQEQVETATLAAAAGNQQLALDVLGQCAALYLQQVERCAHAAKEGKATDNGSGNCPAAAGSSQATKTRTPLEQVLFGLFTAGLVTRAGGLRNADRLDPEADRAARQLRFSFRPPGVYTTFLAAWVKARRQLQQLPQEVAATVVAAVKAAEQQQQRMQQWQDSLGQTHWLEWVRPADHAAADPSRQVGRATQTAASSRQQAHKATQTSRRRQQVSRGVQAGGKRLQQVNRAAQTARPLKQVTKAVQAASRCPQVTKAVQVSLHEPQAEAAVQASDIQLHWLDWVGPADQQQQQPIGLCGAGLPRRPGGMPVAGAQQPPQLQLRQPLSQKAETPAAVQQQQQQQWEVEVEVATADEYQQQPWLYARSIDQSKLSSALPGAEAPAQRLPGQSSPGRGMEAGGGSQAAGGLKRLRKKLLGVSPLALHVAYVAPSSSLSP
jgi:hypothetical protein